MCTHAVPGAADPQLQPYPAASILQAVTQQPVADIADETLRLADHAANAMRQVRESEWELLGDRYSAE
jgi:hypothetical protein